MSASKATLSLATFAVAATLSVSGSTSASAQQAARPQPTYTKVYESDSTGISAPELSPNGRWIV